MFNNEAFQQNLLVAELGESDIVSRPTGDLTSPLGFALVNHNRNNNIKVQIRPKKQRPSVPGNYVNQNPTAFVDDERGELNMCLTHADDFIISCAGAPSTFVFASSFGQMLADLSRNNPNIFIHVNGAVYDTSSFITRNGNNYSFNPQFLEGYGVTYTDTLGNYRLAVGGANTVRFEVRVMAPGNGMTAGQVTTLFGQSNTEVNDTVVYHSNSDFYGFTFCMESASIPSRTRIDYATIETMDELLNSGLIDNYHDDANSLDIQTKVPGEESALSAEFKARLLNSFEDTPVRYQDYLLVLESPDVDLTTIDPRKIKATYDIYSKAAPVQPQARTMSLMTMATVATETLSTPVVGDLIASNIEIDTSKLYNLNGRLVYPMTMGEDDNGQLLKFRIDFDGEESLFTEAEHLLEINVAKASDVTIPLLVDYETEKPQNLANLTYAVFERHQFYQFAINMQPDTVLYIELPDLNETNVEITIPNHADVKSIDTYQSHVKPNGYTRGWYTDHEELVVIQLKVPIGITGNVKIIQRNCTEELNGLTRSPAGKLSPITNDQIVYVTNLEDSKPKLRVVNYSHDFAIAYAFVQNFNTMQVGQAIAFAGIPQLWFVQGINSMRDYSRNGTSFAHVNGKSGDWISLSPRTGGYDYQDNAGKSGNALIPVSNPSNVFTVAELLINGIRLHYYALDANLVPVTYLGNSFINWKYDTTKSLSIVALVNNSNSYLGSPYDVSEGDLGPLRSDFVLSHTYDIRITDITEV